ncbi:ATP-binding cassette domain-containing protein (plasmid) [Pseudorhodobacter turbinis]|uniref:ATP-binding cassette domain-containing protein n=1 Tax=Pseudorhodobacter turbinis TaxID=2500533 RepID=A0A4P8EKJ3_9RHOB|nr:ATP-binding cassette domain-containing protein [Pseudorhodobacter turbinis]QCO57577.1 ATP-binding cassette domain-containing protein [Pseudorhodobacter turbinis]
MARSDPLRLLLVPVAPAMRRLSAVAVLASMIWPLQAALVALAIGAALQGQVAGALVAGFVVLGLGRAALSALADRMAQNAAEAVITNLRCRIVTREALRSGRDLGPGATASLAVEKLAALSPWITRYAPASARVAVVPLVILALAFWQSWAAGLILLISGPLIPLFMALVGMAAKEASARQMAEIGSLNDLLVDRLAALLDIRLLGAAGAVTQGFATQAGDLRQRTMAVLRLAFLSSTVLELFSAIGVAMMAVFVGFSLLGQLGFGTWGAPLTPTAGVFLLLLAPEFYQPLRDLAAAWHDKAAADAVADELAVWEAGQGDALPGTGARTARLSGPATINLRDCVTAHGLHLPDMRIDAGQAVALVGLSGAGKTSALRLMAGLELPGAGSVEVAGQPLTEERVDAWRARIGWMPQRAAFLATSLRANLALGRDGDLDAALDNAAAREVAEALPRGLATRLGESGGGLSGGEARRMTLARALFSQPDLILADEPTADLDRTTAQAVTEGLLAQHANGRTLIVATHDTDLAAQMDRIIRLGDTT